MPPKGSQEQKKLTDVISTPTVTYGGKNVAKAELGSAIDPAA